MVQHWWHLTVIALAMVLLAAAGVIFARAPALPHTLAYGLVRQMATGQAAWQTRNWLEADSAHFRLRYRPEDAALASLVLENAEDVYGPVAGLLAYEPAGKTLIILHPDRQSLARQFGWAASESAMGVYWGGVIRLLSPYDWIASRDPEEIAAVFTSSGPVAHEFTHLLVDARARGNYPRWLTEGIAQFVEKQLTGFTMPGAPGAGEWYPLGEMD
ncbi:MAG: hypothetical protein H5T99_06890, partial [Moorella sp. (in: Bacteria)]|nr:hypothetical protein [Moorella sp. (in: firmicutes)]